MKIYSVSSPTSMILGAHEPEDSRTRRPSEPWTVATSTNGRFAIMRPLDDTLLLPSERGYAWKRLSSVVQDWMSIRKPSLHAYERRTNRANVTKIRQRLRRLQQGFWPCTIGSTTTA